MKNKVDKFYNDLRQEVAAKLKRKLTKKEKHFLQWLAKRHINEKK